MTPNLFGTMYIADNSSFYSVTSIHEYNTFPYIIKQLNVAE